MNCKDCQDTGIAIVSLDNTNDVAIQCCDTCKRFTDKEAIDRVKDLVYRELERSSKFSLKSYFTGCLLQGHTFPDNQSPPSCLRCNITGPFGWGG